MSELVNQQIFLVRENFKPNSGRDAVPVFLHRGKLPKLAPVPLVLPGTDFFWKILEKNR